MLKWLGGVAKEVGIEDLQSGDFFEQKVLKEKVDQVATAGKALGSKPSLEKLMDVVQAAENLAEAFFPVILEKLASVRASVGRAFSLEKIKEEESDNYSSFQAFLVSVQKKLVYLVVLMFTEVYFESVEGVLTLFYGEFRELGAFDLRPFAKAMHAGVNMSESKQKELLGLIN